MLAATGRGTLEDALDWIAADNALHAGTDLHSLLQATVELHEDGPAATAAIRQLARQVTASDLDTASVIFDADSVAGGDAFRAALDLLAWKSPDHTLTTLNSSAVLAAQKENPFTMETLCAVAGLSYGDLEARVAGDLPSEATAHWSPAQVRAAFSVIEDVVQDRVQAALPGSVPARPVELLPGIAGQQVPPTWESVEQMRRGGVRYEVLLAQRAAGGAWLAHRNRTSGKIAHSIAARLCQELANRGLSYRRSTSVGGDTQPARIHELSDAGKQVGVVALNDDGVAIQAIIFSIARDSGTASKNIGRLRTMAHGARVPVSMVLAGAGWSARNETADLAIAYGGRVYSERSLDRLAEEVQSAAQPTTAAGGSR